MGWVVQNTNRKSCIASQIMLPRSPADFGHQYGDAAITRIVVLHVFCSLVKRQVWCPNERETADRSLLDKATEYITRSFPTHSQFYPENLFVATWNEVGYYDSQNDKVRHELCSKIAHNTQRNLSVATAYNVLLQ